MALYVDYNSPPAKSISTTLIFPIDQTSIYGQSGNYYSIEKRYHFEFLTQIPEGGKVDFQVEAILGHNSTYWYIQHPLYPEYGGLYQSAIAYDSTSGWSNTQTIRIPDGSISSSTSPSPTPTVPEYSWLAIVPLLLSLFSIALVLRHRKTANLKQ